MDWWYKSDKHEITEVNKSKLQDAIRTVLREGKSLVSIELYKDAVFYYIKTNNKIALNHFLYQNGFEEQDEEEAPENIVLINP